MPVRRFRSVEEMNAPLWRQPGEPELYRTMAALWAFGRRTRPRTYPPGVHRHASIEHMDRVQHAWAEQHATSQRAQRVQPAKE
jgi:hypothetical protein